MAHLQRHESSGRYRIRFRYAGVEYKRSLKTQNEKAAEGVRARVEETLRLLDLGRLDIPEGTDPGLFILSDGKRTSKPEVRKVYSVRSLFEFYQDSLPPGAKEATTLLSEGIHVRHLLKHLPASRPAQSLTVADLQRYADLRSRDKWRGKTIGPDTIRKELATFRLIWNWAVERGHLSGAAPIKGVRLAKPNEKPPFMTWEDIEAIVRRGGLTDDEIKSLWASLFLSVTEVNELLDHVERSARLPFIYPMFVFTAHTGARRSEVLRSRIDDFDFRNGVVHIREKKKSRTKSITYRHVDLTPRLEMAMQRWFAEHPGGSLAISRREVKEGTPRGVPLTTNEAVHYFRDALDGSKWEKVRGFHVFRHSFASNFAAAGVDQRVVDAFLGHQTEEMRRRYRHLFPEHRRKAIASVFCS